jgi:hypothetical protein
MDAFSWICDADVLDLHEVQERLLMRYVAFGPGCVFGPLTEADMRKLLTDFGCVPKPTDELIGEYVDCDKDKVIVYDAKDKEEQLQLRHNKNLRLLQTIFASAGLEQNIEDK